MPSIKDVATLAGVSFTTVSHVLNGTRKVHPATRERVLRAVEACGYVPSAAARALRGAPSRVIGMLVPDVSDPFCAELTLGAERAAAAAGYSVVLANTHPRRLPDAPAIESLLGRHLDGLLVVAGLFEHQRLLQRLRAALGRRQLPVVFIDDEPGPLASEALCADAVACAQEATSHLLALGHRRIACLSGPLIMPVAQQRVVGWRQALQAAGLTAEAAAVEESDFSVAGGYRATQALLQRWHPTAVLACNDARAIGAMRALAEAGLRVPQDCSVVGIDGIECGAFTHPPLTTVGESLPQVGEWAVQRLLHRLSHPDAPNARWTRTPRLIVRASTAPAPTA